MFGTCTRRPRTWPSKTECRGPRSASTTRNSRRRRVPERLTKSGVSAGPACDPAALSHRKAPFGSGTAATPSHPAPRATRPRTGSTPAPRPDLPQRPGDDPPVVAGAGAGVPAVGLDQPTHERACHAEHVSREGGDLADADHGSRRRLRPGPWGPRACAGVPAGPPRLRPPPRRLPGALHPNCETPYKPPAERRAQSRPPSYHARRRGDVGQLVGPRPVDQRLEDGADADALLDGNGFDPCAPIVIEAQAQDGGLGGRDGR